MARKSKRKKGETPQVSLALRTPFSSELEACIAALYEACGVRCVSRQLQVCFCNCCMTETMRHSIIETPNAELSPAQIREYSNSAHGTVNDPDDLIVLLPRYAELLAQDISVDYNDSDEILWRFGDALKRGALPASVCTAYLAWGRAYFRHAVWAEANDLDTVIFAYGATKLLLSGGFSGSEIAALLSEAVQREEGVATTSWLATHVFITRLGGAADPKLDFIWTDGIQEGAVGEVLDWFKGPDYRNAIARALMSDLPYDRFMACKIVDDWFAVNG